MLLLKNIVKHYTVGDNIIQALRGVNLEFRKSEFVSILGPSGCGKTTLLNIIGGLDRYTSGDLSVNGTSTKEFKDKDWDAYRNRSIGFVFQTYNLISHQTVLSNVELAMTLSGVSKSQRRNHAIEVLKKVGLEDQIHKKPNQLSGGQMQRVAIARSLVNDPEIVLADEPTGALDSGTSIQIMEILKEIAKDRLVIMVTHNPDIANKYSTRIIKLLDGLVTDDSNPYSENELDIQPPTEKSKQKGKKSEKTSRVSKTPRTSMSFFTALSLSLTNLMTKKARTFLTAFAGSIGIIGIALILSLSNGVQLYIERVEEDTLSSYPITIQRTSMDMTAIIGTSMGMHESMHKLEDRELDKIYSNDIMKNVITTMTANRTENDLANFKRFIDNNKDKNGSLASFTNDIKYSYSTSMNIYKSDTSEGSLEDWQVNPSNLMRSMNIRGMGNMMGSMAGMEVWQELLDNEDVLNAQFDVIAGRMPEKYNEVVLIVDENNAVTDFTLYTLGLKDRQDLADIFSRDPDEDDDVTENKDGEEEQLTFTYDEILALNFKLVLNTDFFEKDEDENIWVNKSDNIIYMKEVIDNAVGIEVVGILRPTENSVANMNGAGFIGYTKSLMNYLIDKVNESPAAIEQKANPDTDIFTGKLFSSDEDDPDEANISDFDYSSLSEEEQAYLMSMDEESRAALIASYMVADKSESTYENNLRILGVSDLDNPRSIEIYPSDFASKDEILKIIDDYNKEMSDSGQEEFVINYTDFVGLMMSSVSNIISTISAVLIAFVAIALVVSSIMIGIITYISVLERTKEIGILRSIGASKNDISRVFNAETMIIGFTAGLIGIGVTLLLCIPANIIIKAISDISNVAALPLVGGVVLIAISMVLTLIAGFIPSKIAAKKDPVVALRTE
ncbi:MAG: ABC transporter ATP-binding protein/permease [Oscillospiraceae bacterium]|nr:ABC transporter ATP-binding protein/permease [Oscillospiraceae bacterium]